MKAEQRIEALLNAFKGGNAIRIRDYIPTTEMARITQRILKEARLITRSATGDAQKLYKWANPNIQCPQSIIDAIVQEYRGRAYKTYEKGISVRENSGENPLLQYTPRQLLAELKRRGYVWDKLYIKQEIPYNNI